MAQRQFSVRSRSSHSSRNWWLLVIGLATVTLIILVLELTNTTHFFHKPAVPAVIPVTNGAGKQSSAHRVTGNGSSSTTGSLQSSSDNSKVASSTGGSSSTNNLVQPYGSFVSNHMVSGSNTAEESVCATSTGASCYIEFTEASGKTTRLPAQKVDQNGYTKWAWDASILSSGLWQIQAVATLGNQTKSTTDSIKLVVQ